MSEFLTAQDLHSLTGFAHASKQAAWLKEQGLPHRVDGRRIIISRVHVQAWLEGRPTRSSNGPNWAALSNA